MTAAAATTLKTNLVPRASSKTENLSKTFVELSKIDFFVEKPDTPKIRND